MPASKPLRQFRQNVTVDAGSAARSLKVSWNGVSGAVSYEVLKRKIGFENRREPNGKREFADGDASTTGFRHVAFVDGNQLSYEDKGAVHEVFAPEGLNNLFDSEYVVRAIGVNSKRSARLLEFQRRDAARRKPRRI